MKTIARQTAEVVEGNFNLQDGVTNAPSEREELLASEINLITAQTKHLVLINSIEIGKRLCEAKQLVKHGTWGAWLKEKVDYSQRTANNFMKIYKEYGEQLQSDSNSNALANLSYSQALALIELPSDRREQFVSSRNVETLPYRKLQEEVKEECARLKSQSPEQIVEEDSRIADELSIKKADLVDIKKQLTALSETTGRLESRLQQNLSSGMRKAVESALQDAKTQQSEITDRYDTTQTEIDRLNALKLERVKALIEPESSSLPANLKYTQQVSQAKARATCSAECLVTAYKKTAKEIQTLASLDRVAAKHLFDDLTGTLNALQSKITRDLQS